jgi:hypothetical protein
MTWLTDLADVARAAGLAVVEVDGWRTRSRSPGVSYATNRPTHVMVHHTASPPSSDGRRDVDYIVSGSDVAPLANLYLDRSGTVWTCAAGPTNTNGKGSSRSWSGGVPDDLMNVYAIGIEAANTGTGERWPTVQTDAYVTLVRALCDRYGIPVGHVRAHAEWAPGRKIDPAGPSPWAPNGGTWNMDAFRASIATHSPPTPTPIPPTPNRKEADAMLVHHRRGTPDYTGYSWTGVDLTWLRDGNAAEPLVRAGAAAVDVSDVELSAVIASSATVGPPPPTLQPVDVTTWHANKRT